MAVTAVIPLKSLGQAKRRLASQFDPTTRRELVAWMFGRVVGACAAASSIGDILVVAGDGEAAELAARHRATVLVEPRAGLAAALAAADDACRTAEATLVVAADLPLAAAADLDAVCDAGARRPCVVVAPTRDGGTGALLRRPPAVIAPAYGLHSAAAHLSLAAAAGVPGVRLDLPRLALDVDTPAALREATAAAGRLPSA